MTTQTNIFRIELGSHNLSANCKFQLYQGKNSFPPCNALARPWHCDCQIHTLIRWARKKKQSTVLCLHTYVFNA